MAVSKEEKVHNVFEKISTDYDKMNSVISFNQHIKWRNDIMVRMNVQPGSKALDVCCGTADWTVALAKAAGPAGEVTGLDFSANMLESGREKVAPYPNIELVQGNAMSLPFPDNSFDYVTIGFGLRNVPDYLTVLKEMHRVLKPGGMAVCLETSQTKIPVYRQAFRFYFKYIMPLFGKLFAKSYKEYSWLQESANDFPGMKELAQLFVEAGYQEVSYKSYSGGAAAGHIAYK
ncbi:demethylmenaquinone methyltransferase [Mammaliicoccus sciuri]|uniref:Demethylmenaquinone methyltransferase n=2 Tax=Sporosarcina newyorkensis TaxID=759851 RepID=A0A1T4XE84_9BACL|nr:demethylmenaquinone methyltransferase [Sporosarcina newyorkensis]EGQ27571.1 ubiquinone/menaquinone biosynthesis methyltransferase UbiE [Sporosarcina newyorkensis 2681]MBY0222701.1 demethylmenaquinone methyltransferase [Sporosarcina aquimarina]SKA87435.1 demethylmenaquinone methyltransferase / 2-methoxy-6-polyprenyl-1,4-benzoquinol methylase [Sporosarcina newyorkensis]